MLLTRWVDVVAARLGVDIDIDIGALLDLAGDIERQVERPAAPLTMFLLGYAVAQAGDDSPGVHEATDAVRSLLADSRS